MAAFFCVRGWYSKRRMRASRWISAVLGSVLLLGAGLRGYAQQPEVPAQQAPKSDEPHHGARPSEPGTGSTQVKPASKAPEPVQAPNVRLDSKPHTDIDYTVDSSKTPPDLGLGATPKLDLGHDILPVTPPGMLSRGVPGNPRMVYFALPHRSGNGITPEDRATIDARQSDLVRAAAFHGFDLHQSGWMYQQGVCPAMQPDAEQVVGVPPAGDGSILLHLIREEGEGRASAFTALVPRDPVLPVRAVAVAHRSVESGRALLTANTSGGVVTQALPPATLYANMEPVKGWIAASACIAEIGGAYPHIPNETFLSEDILTAPTPLIRLLLNGERKVTFTDRIDEKHYVVWDQHVSNHGRMLDAQHETVRIVARPVTNPPAPKPRMIANIPEPKTRITPEPPSPISGNKQ